MQRKASEYRTWVGQALFIAGQTRPDISAAVTVLSKFVSNPGEQHHAAAKQLIRYLASTRELGIVWRCHIPGPSNRITAYTDSDWAGDMDTARSTTGYLLECQGGPVAWRSKQQPLIAQSVFEAELLAINAGALTVQHFAQRGKSYPGMTLFSRSSGLARNRLSQGVRWIYDLCYIVGGG